MLILSYDKTISLTAIYTILVIAIYYILRALQTIERVGGWKLIYWV